VAEAVMRGVRSLVVLLLIAIPLGWYVYRDSKRTAADDEPKKEKVFTVESDKIDEMTIKSESGEQTRLQKSGADWKIVAPSAAQPDSTEVSGLTSNLSSLEMQRVVDENPPDLKEYGLAPPRIEVSFKAGGQQQTLLIGQKTPPGSDLYAKRGSDKKVFLIGSHLESTFNRKTFDLRDKSVLKIDRDKLDALEVSSGEKITRFVRPAGEWQIAAPIQGRADFSAIEGLVSRLTGLQMKSIVDAPDSDQKKYGLDKPAATVRLGTGSAQATLALGGKAEAGTVYARDLSRPAVFTVESSVLDELKKDPSEYRQKDLFDARSFNATRVEIVRGGQTSAFEKTKVKNKQGQDEEKWRQISPQARDLDQASFDALLAAVTATRATGFVDGATAKALAAPDLTITIKFDEGKKEDRVTLVKAGTDAFAARAGEPGAAKVEASAIDSIVKALQELK
jgi:Domain of unknown function (DUF4340)